MNKNLLAIIPAIILAFASTQLVASGGSDIPDNKPMPDMSKFTAVCHKINHPNFDKLPDGNPHYFLLWVPNSALKAHLRDTKNTSHEDELAVLDPSSGEYICGQVPAFCGDFNVDPGEECDEGPSGGAIPGGPFICESDCTIRPI